VALLPVPVGQPPAGPEHVRSARDRRLVDRALTRGVAEQAAAPAPALPRLVPRRVERARAMELELGLARALEEQEALAQHAVSLRPLGVRRDRFPRRTLRLLELPRLLRLLERLEPGGGEPRAGQRRFGLRLARGLELLAGLREFYFRLGDVQPTDPRGEEAERARSTHAGSGQLRARERIQPEQLDGRVVEAVRPRHRERARHAHASLPEAPTAHRLAQLEAGVERVVVLLERGDEREIRTQQGAGIRHGGEPLGPTVSEGLELEARPDLVSREPGGEQVRGPERERGEVLVVPRRDRQEQGHGPVVGKRRSAEDAPGEDTCRRDTEEPHPACAGPAGGARHRPRRRSRLGPRPLRHPRGRARRHGGVRRFMHPRSRQGLRQLRTRRVSRRGVARQQARDQVGERLGDRGIQARDRVRRAVHEMVEQRAVSATLERMPGREHLVEHRPEREQVGTLVDVPAVVRLGRHVARRAGGSSRLPDRAGRVVGAHAARVPLAPERDAEVEDLDLAAGGEHEVLGLDVAVDHALRVRGAQGFHTLTRQPPERLERHRLAQALAQRPPFHVLHHDEHVVAEVQHVMDRGDAVIAHLTRAARLGEDRVAHVGGLRPVRAQVLERHATAEQRVVREQDLAHAAAAEHTLDTKTPEQDAAGSLGRAGSGSGRIGSWHESPADPVRGVPHRAACACGASIRCARRDTRPKSRAVEARVRARRMREDPWDDTYTAGPVLARPIHEPAACERGLSAIRGVVRPAASSTCPPTRLRRGRPDSLRLAHIPLSRLAVHE